NRWDAGDVREVFHATRSRAEAAFEAADGIAELPAFGTWGGEASEAAKESIGQVRKDLDAHGNEALAVAQAARKAADDVEAVKSRLTQLRADATSAGFEIDPISNQVLLGPALEANMVEALAAEATRQELQARVTAILAEAARVDQELASAIAMATGAELIPEGPHSNDPAVQDMLTDPPEDPQQFHDAWENLSQEQRDWLYEQDHAIGNHPGMPFEDKDHYNRMHLSELQAANQAELDRLAKEHPGWTDGRPDTPNPSPPGFQEWKAQWDNANKTRQGYEQVQRALESPDGLQRYLGVIDDQGHAAVSINNPDTAIRNGTFVPGTGQDLSRLEYSASKSEAMLQATLEADRNLKVGDVSMTTWMGYDRPMSILTDAPSPSFAHDGAAALDDFQAGMRASHDLAAGPSVNTVIGHSYGSTLVGAAGLDGHLDANNVVAVGSPGVLADHASDLSLAPDANVFASRAENDLIGIATYATLGPDPMGQGFGAIPFEAAPGAAGPFGTPTIDAHSSYWSPGNPALLNMGRIIAGRTDVTPPTFTP
ncbi:alpha/beta hydrolase, partial [Mycolicibacterium chlorophenolicum]